ncbi:hypothetical protein P879_11056, partial [Paragonimus westermani]
KHQLILDVRAKGSVETNIYLQIPLTPSPARHLAYSLNVMERMVCQNIWDDIIMDFLGYDDPADEFRIRGTLYPLWRFRHMETRRRKLPVTVVLWSKRYTDLFFVGYGLRELFILIKKYTHPHLAFVNIHTCVTI